jgi:hypothetical protein
MRSIWQVSTILLVLQRFCSATVQELAISDTIKLGLTRHSHNSGYLRRITYYPRRLSDAELQAITA